MIARALITDPARIPAGRYRRFVRRAELRGLLADHLYRGEPYLALNALVLDAESDALLRRLSEAFAGAFQRAGQALAADVPGLIELGFPWVAAELLAAERPLPPLLGRFDFVQDEAGHWWLLEFNADTPSGIRESVAACALAAQLLPEARELRRPNAGLVDELVAAFEQALRGLPRGSALGIVTNAGELEDLAQMAYTRELLLAPLARRGIEVVLGDRDNLALRRGELTLCGQRVQALYRYLPFEWMLGSSAFSAIVDAVAGGRLRLLNGLYGLLLQHKALLAWLWQRRADPCLSESERAVITRHLPPAWLLHETPPEVDPREIVLKQVFGREGEEVFFGADLSQDDLRELRRRRTYIAQQRVAVATLDAVIPTAAGQEARAGMATVGSYTARGRWAGYYTRFGGRVITARAKWLATLTAP